MSRAAREGLARYIAELDGSFQVRVASTGATPDVAAVQSRLDVRKDAGITVPASARKASAAHA
jgi:hypothetical protein